MEIARENDEKIGKNMQSKTKRLLSSKVAYKKTCPSSKPSS